MDVVYISGSYFIIDMYYVVSQVAFNKHMGACIYRCFKAIGVERLNSVNYSVVDFIAVIFSRFPHFLSKLGFKAYTFFVTG